MKSSFIIIYRKYFLIYNLKTIVCVLLSVSFLSVSAQEQLSVRQRAEEFFQRMEYAEAIPLFEKLLLKKKRPKAKYIERLASSYLYINDYESAENWYARALQTSKHSSEAKWGYIQSLKQSGKYSEAKSQLIEYARDQGSTPSILLELAGCDSAASWIATPLPYHLKGVHEVNSSLSEFGAFPLSDKLIYVAEPRVGAGKRSGMSGNSFLRLFVARRSGLDLSFPEPLQDEAFSSISYHLGPLVATRNEDTLYVTQTYEGRKVEKYRFGGRRFRKYNLDLKVYIKKEQHWVVQDFPYSNSSSYSVGHAALSEDGMQLYFSSDRPGGYGGVDIWYCQKKSDGSWGSPLNAGPVINSIKDEVFPAIYQGKLYYSSDGFAGMGGFDIFVAKGDAGRWVSIENMRYPINSASDDFAFVPIVGEEEDFQGYLSSNRGGGAGADDLYSFSYQKPKINIVLHGAAFDKKTGEPLGETMLSLFDGSGRLVARKESEADGSFTFALSKGTVHRVFAEHKGYMADSLRIDAVYPKADSALMASLYLAPLNKVGDKLVLENLYYDFDKSTIRPDAAVVLDQVVRVMRDNPSLHIELSSHTDSRGSDAYNMKLSQRRAQSAVAYIVSRGISYDRLKAMGYGESKLLNRCSNEASCGEEEHQANRRTELEVIAN
ncbi:OmpA family protein [Sphingobacterium sp. LRF_L2]|uniref:OmpA family protein n=1 Tax=Sphingobacterium sp. LRF_L2 TaxID=3369421 RepID=UPI003F628644